jgi:deoxyguanosine kinase
MSAVQAYIAIEGVIGVGKTTLARMLHKELGGQLVLEVFEENPFLSSFYQDRARYAFQTQIFFLLSRYHQQRQLASMARPLISDYMFDKDRLFAEVNLAGDELKTYYSVQEALAENVLRPDLVVFLKADTDTLMSRITARDRPYERNMDPAYIDSLRVAYERFFSAYQAAPVLAIDTNDIDFVRNAEDRAEIFSRIRGALGAGPRQPALPGLEAGKVALGAGEALVPDQAARRLGDYQQHLRQQEAQPGDPFLNFLRLQREIGALAETLAEHWQATRSDEGGRALPPIRDRLAGVFACLLALANQAQVDLEEAYLERLHEERVTGQPEQASAEGGEA